MTYLARITDWIRPWGPAGWGAVGIISALLLAMAVTLIRLIAASAAKRRAEAKAVNKWAENVNDVNPMEHEFRNQRISLADLANPVTKQIIGKRFIGCELVGPTTILLGPGSIRSSGFLATNLIPIKNDFPHSPVYTLLHCDIIECLFLDMNILLPIQSLPALEHGFPPKSLPYLTLTGNPDIDSRPFPVMNGYPPTHPPQAPPRPTAGTPPQRQP